MIKDILGFNCRVFFFVRVYEIIRVDEIMLFFWFVFFENVFNLVYIYFLV